MWLHRFTPFRAAWEWRGHFADLSGYPGRGLCCLCGQARKARCGQRRGSVRPADDDPAARWLTYKVFARNTSPCFCNYKGFSSRSWLRYFNILDSHALTNKANFQNNQIGFFCDIWTFLNTIAISLIPAIRFDFRTFIKYTTHSRRRPASANAEPFLGRFVVPSLEWSRTSRPSICLINKTVLSSFDCFLFLSTIFTIIHMTTGAVCLPRYFPDFPERPYVANHHPYKDAAAR